ncbi:MAG: GNAT family N-acetyltransferase [Nocardia sp.]|nr:GNAT family N-acetyltransferase [Nocardia sp.]
MNSAHSANGAPAVVITRTGRTRWQATDDDLVVGHADMSPRPDGLRFVSVDVWHESVFDPLAATMLADLPRPLYTVVDESDERLLSAWRRHGFITGRREWEYQVPTDLRRAGAHRPEPPADIRIVPAGAADERRLREVDRAIRDEVEASVGWQQMPAELLPRLSGNRLRDRSRYAAAAQADRYVGLIRVAGVTRLPRIGLIAVRSQLRRRGIARALLAHSLGVLHSTGIATATAEINETNVAATALLEDFGARRVGSNLELVLR